MSQSAMHFDLDPPHGVGPLRLGMTLDETRAALITLGDLDGGEQTGLWATRPSGLGFNPGFGSTGRLDSVEITRPHALDVVRYRDVDVFGLPALEVVERLRRHTHLAEDEDQEGCFTAADLLLALWRPFAADDDPHDEQGYHFSSVLLARPGYYDTPAEAAARSATGDLPGY